MVSTSTLVVLFPCLDWTAAASTVFGQKFLVSYTRMTHHYLAWPQITPELFFLVMSRHWRNQIHITTVWFNATDRYAPLDMKVELNRTVPALFVTIPKTYHYRINIGVQHSFSLVSSQDFALVILLFDHVFSTAAFRALPLEGWGRGYYAVTLGYFISLVTVANEGPNTLSYTINAEHPDTFLLTHDRSYRAGTQWEVTLLAYQVYVWSSCNLHVQLGSVTGTKIVGIKTFGLISGNCWSNTKTRKCDSQDYDIEGSYDIAAEMLMPSETYGKEFMTFYMEGIQTAGYYVFVASKALTVVTVYANVQNESEQFTLAKDGDWVTREIMLSRISSTEGIQLMFVARSACKGPSTFYAEPGDPSLCVIVPSNLFYHVYMWRSPVVLNTENFVAVMIQSKHLDQLRLNKVLFHTRVQWVAIPGAQGWLFGQDAVNESGTYDLHTDNAVFGCYLYGHSDGASYVYPAGYISSPINEVCETTLTSAAAGDLIDNDCDERIDEEQDNGLDDDEDGLVDEDLNPFVAAVQKTATDASAMTTTAQPATTTMQIVAASQPATTTMQIVAASQPSTTTIQTVETTLATHTAKPETSETTALTSIREFGPSMTPSQSTTLAFRRTSTMTMGRVTSALPLQTSPVATVKANMTTLSSFITTLRVFNTTKRRITYDQGVFSQWSQWYCDKNCDDHRQLRKRVCIRKTSFTVCQGPTIVWRKSTCYINNICPFACPLFSWDVDCTRSCSNCLSDCDKFNGSCTDCKPGFQNPHTGCQEECDENSFGFHCKGNCFDKCGADCAEKINGTCVDTGEYSQWSLWMCTRNCSESRMYRTRICTKRSNSFSCQGPFKQWINGNCFVNNTCPKKCPPSYWNVGCNLRCDNCENDCDKFNGSCVSCKPGYHLPQYGCVDVCPENTYGKDCLGNCLDNCGADCMDRETGACYSFYGEWESWHCSEDCLNPMMIRKRYCKNPAPGVTCLGKNIETKSALCYTGKKCPKDCPAFKWDVDCKMDCANCHSDCNKFTGTCDYCKPGYKWPEKGCIQSCEVNEYGVNCNGNCLRKCKEDCLDRVTGECPRDKWKYVVAVLLVAVLPILFIFCRRTPDERALKHLYIEDQSSSEPVYREVYFYPVENDDDDNKVLAEESWPPEKKSSEEITASDYSLKSTEV